MSSRCSLEHPGTINPLGALASFCTTQPFPKFSAQLARPQKSKGRAATGTSQRDPQARPQIASSAQQDERRAQLRALFLETARGFIGGLC